MVAPPHSNFIFSKKTKIYLTALQTGGVLASYPVQAISPHGNTSQHSLRRRVAVPAGKTIDRRDDRVGPSQHPAR
jgi:hypothetical protein